MKKLILVLSPLIVFLFSCEDNRIYTNADFLGTWNATFIHKGYTNGELTNSYEFEGYQFILNENGEGEYFETLNSNTIHSECNWTYVSSKNEIHIGLRDTSIFRRIAYEVKELSEESQYWEIEYTFEPISYRSIDAFQLIKQE